MCNHSLFIVGIKKTPKPVQLVSVWRMFGFLGSTTARTGAEVRFALKALKDSKQILLQPLVKGSLGFK